MVCFHACITLRTRRRIAQIPRGLEEKAADVAILPNSSSATGRAVERACFMRICQPCRSSARSNIQAVTIDSCILMSLVTLLETMSHLCRFRSNFGEILFSRRRRSCSCCVPHSCCSGSHYKLIIERINKSPYIRPSALNSLVKNNSEGKWMGKNYTRPSLLILLQIYTLLQIEQ